MLDCAQMNWSIADLCIFSSDSYPNYTKNKFTELKQKHSQLIPIENRQEIINDLTKFIENSIHNTCKTILGQKHYRKSKLILL